jgi:hypothetical protein
MMWLWTMKVLAKQMQHEQDRAGADREADAPRRLRFVRR